MTLFRSKKKKQKEALATAPPTAQPAAKTKPERAKRSRSTSSATEAPAPAPAATRSNEQLGPPMLRHRQAQSWSHDVSVGNYRVERAHTQSSHTSCNYEAQHSAVTKPASDSSRDLLGYSTSDDQGHELTDDEKRECMHRLYLMAKIHGVQETTYKRNHPRHLRAPASFLSNTSSFMTHESSQSTRSSAIMSLLPGALMAGVMTANQDPSNLAHVQKDEMSQRNNATNHNLQQEEELLRQKMRMGKSQCSLHNGSEREDRELQSNISSRSDPYVGSCDGYERAPPSPCTKREVDGLSGKCVTPSLDESTASGTSHGTKLNNSSSTSIERQKQNQALPATVSQAVWVHLQQGTSSMKQKILELRALDRMQSFWDAVIAGCSGRDVEGNSIRNMMSGSTTGERGGCIDDYRQARNNLTSDLCFLSTSAAKVDEDLIYQDDMTLEESVVYRQWKEKKRIAKAKASALNVIESPAAITTITTKSKHKRRPSEGTYCGAILEVRSKDTSDNNNKGPYTSSTYTQYAGENDDGGETDAYKDEYADDDDESKTMYTLSTLGNGTVGRGQDFFPDSATNASVPDDDLIIYEDNESQRFVLDDYRTSASDYRDDLGSQLLTTINSRSAKRFSLEDNYTLTVAKGKVPLKATTSCASGAPQILSTRQRQVDTVDSLEDVMEQLDCSFDAAEAATRAAKTSTEVLKMSLKKHYALPESSSTFDVCSSAKDSELCAASLQPHLQHHRALSVDETDATPPDEASHDEMSLRSIDRALDQVHQYAARNGVTIEDLLMDIETNFTGGGSSMDLSSKRGGSVYSDREISRSPNEEYLNLFRQPSWIE